jgi:hypothetical protein
VRRANENICGSGEENYVSSSPQEDCGIPESAMGENKGAAEKGCLEGEPQLTQSGRRAYVLPTGLESGLSPSRTQKASEG